MIEFMCVYMCVWVYMFSSFFTIKMIKRKLANTQQKKNIEQTKFQPQNVENIWIKTTHKIESKPQPPI